jgi:hypothetical protein
MNVQIKLQNVKQVYIGYTEGCTCGCQGSYVFTTEANTEWRKKNPYAKFDLCPDDKEVQRIIDLMKDEQDIVISIAGDEIQFKSVNKYILFYKP